jgi:3-hydroxybutyryl-CoA dehydrogenase
MEAGPASSCAGWDAEPDGNREAGFCDLKYSLMNANLVKKALVVGSGVMGSSIAQVLAASDIDVTLVDVDEKVLERAMGRIDSALNTLAESGRLARDKIPCVLARIQTTTDLAAAAKEANFAIEAVPEIPALKKKILEQLGGFCDAQTIVASNTSSLDIFSIAAVKRPERLIIAHFFAPAHIIPLVEIVPGAQTSAETVAITAELLQGLGKSPVVLQRVAPGFIVNRIQMAINEACMGLIDEGVAGPHEIDSAIKLSLGIRLPIVGVVQSLDFAGLDMVLDVMRNSGKMSLVAEKVNKGHLGAKTSRGFYEYQGRSETEILKKRDELYLKLLAYLKELHAFDPV